MTIRVDIDCNGQRKITTDDLNQRIFREEWKCCVCEEWTDHEDIVWAKPDGTLTTMEGKPYCQGCLPPEPEEGDAPCTP